MPEELSSIATALGLSVEIKDLNPQARLALLEYLSRAATRMVQQFGTGNGRWQVSDPPAMDDADVVLLALVQLAAVGCR